MGAHQWGGGELGVNKVHQLGVASYQLPPMTVCKFILNALFANIILYLHVQIYKCMLVTPPGTQLGCPFAHTCCDRLHPLLQQSELFFSWTSKSSWHSIMTTFSLVSSYKREVFRAVQRFWNVLLILAGRNAHQGMKPQLGRSPSHWLKRQGHWEISLQGDFPRQHFQGRKKQTAIVRMPVSSPSLLSEVTWHYFLFWWKRNERGKSE